MVSTETPFCCDCIIAHIARTRAADLLSISSLAEPRLLPREGVAPRGYIVDFMLGVRRARALAR